MKSERPPNIIYLLSDEHRGQAMTHAGDPNVQTPWMDRLAAGGASFRTAYSNCPVCTPSRGTIFSGRHAHCGPVPTFFSAYPPAAPSTATWLKSCGYHTSYIGKWHCGIVHDQLSEHVLEHRKEYPGMPSRTPEDRRGGFEEWAGFEVINAPFDTYLYRNEAKNPEKIPGYQTDVLVDEAIRQLESRRREEPLFMVVSVEPPHFPCLPPESTRRLDPDGLQVDASFAKLNPMFADSYPQIDEGDLRQILANYYGMVENLDTNLGRLFQAVRNLPDADNTLLVYLSDHGDYVGNHGMQTCKVQYHEESVRVPALFHWPGRIPPQGLVEGLFGLVDLQATVFGLAGLPQPRWNQGKDWAPRLRGEPCPEPDDLFLEMNGVPRWTPRFRDWRGFVTRDLKYAYYENGQEFLHDLREDPHEMVNLAPDRPDLAASCRARLLEILRETREPYFDVLIEDGVTPAPATYLRNDERQRANARRLGGVDGGTGPLPMA